MKTNWSRFMYIVTFLYIIAMSTLMLYTVRIDSIKLPFVDKFFEGKEMSLLDALLISSDLGGYKKYLILGAGLLFSFAFDHLFTITFIYYNFTKAGKVEKFETDEKHRDVLAKKQARKEAKKIKKIDKEIKRYE